MEIIMATLFETLGHGAWVVLREVVGEPVDPTLASAKPAAPRSEVTMSPYWRRKMQVGTPDPKAVARNAEAMARVAAAKSQ